MAKVPITWDIYRRYENEGTEENIGERQKPSTDKSEFAFSERDSRIIRHLIVVTLFVAMFLVMYPFITREPQKICYRQ